MAEISAWSSVSSLWSSSVQLDPRSLLGLTTLVAPFLNSSKRGSYAWYYSWSLGTSSFYCDIMIPDKEECWQHALDLLVQPLPRHIVASSTLKDSISYTRVSFNYVHSPFHFTIPFHRSIPYSISVIRDTLSKQYCNLLKTCRALDRKNKAVMLAKYVVTTIMWLLLYECRAGKGADTRVIVTSLPHNIFQAPCTSFELA